MNKTKEHILKTSLILFLQKSYKEVTMKDIVSKTGLSKGAFYHHFSSKEELFKEIANLFFSMGQTDYSMFNQQSLKQFYNEYIGYTAISFKEINKMVGVSEDGKTSVNFFLIMFEAISRFPEFLKIELDQYHQSLEAWRKVIKQAKSTGEITSTSTSTEIADLFLFCTDGVFMRYINSENNNTYDADLLKAFNSIYNNIKS